MFKYFLKRLAQMVVTLFIVSILVFVLANFIGDPVNMLVSPKAPPEVREQVREELGLNRPILEQYVSFVTNALKGDFGKSYIYKVDVLSLIAQRVPATLELVLVSVVLALVISIPLGVYAGAFPKRKSSTLVMGGSILGISLPSFFIGIMLIYIFSLKLHWFPSSGRGATIPFLGMDFSLFAPGGLKYIILPAFTLSVTNIASLVRLTRAGVMENMRQDYIKFARAKGVSTRKVLFGHALKNALIPVITVFGMEIGSLIAFTTVTETIYSWPGLGKLLIDSINSVDRPVIVAYLILTTVLFVFINFVVDLLYTVIDPRIEFR
ncbi:MAG: ABC transporter permease [Oscillospiraceae bacterium]